MDGWGKPPICLDAHETYYSFGGSLSWYRPGETTFLTMPSLNYTIAGTLTFPHTQNKETICIVLSFDQRDIDFSVLIILTNLWKLLRLPEGPFYTTINMLAICLPSFTLSRGLVHPFWSLVLKLIAVTSAVYVWTLRLTCVFSWSHTTSKLCRWLAGVFRESLHPYFIRSTSSIHNVFYPLSLLQDHYTTTGSGSQVFM
jgi:hypothetical protein